MPDFSAAVSPNTAPPSTCDARIPGWITRPQSIAATRRCTLTVPFTTSTSATWAKYER